MLSSIAISKGDRAEALAQIQKALAIDPNRAAFHASLGFLQSSDPTTAAAGEDQLRKAVSLDEKNVTAHLVLASMLQKKGDMQGAEEPDEGSHRRRSEECHGARQLWPNSICARTTTPRRSRPSARRPRISSDSESGAGMLATYYIRTNQVVTGAAAYADLVAKHPKSTPLKIAYLRLLILNRDLPKARTVGAELAKTDSSLPEVAVLNGMVLLNDGKTNDAFNELQKAAKANPDSLVVKIWLGRAARAKGDMTVAMQSFRDAVKTQPQKHGSAIGSRRSLPRDT